MHSSVLLHMQYFVKTAHGILEAFYRVVQDWTGQGSGASPSVWLLWFCLMRLPWWLQL
jgi:hypothetical protein